MKMNKGLIIISMIIISLLAIGVASASENVSDVIDMADFEENVAVDDNIDYTVAIEDDSVDIVAVEENVGNSEILYENDGNGSEGNGSQVNQSTKEVPSNNCYDWAKLYGKNSTDDKVLVAKWIPA